MPQPSQPAASTRDDGARTEALPRVLIVSHPAVLTVNQDTYVRLLEFGWDVQLVVPDRWRHPYASGPFPPERHPALDRRIHELPVVFAGKPQRHAYLANLGRLLNRLRPDVAFVEAETFSVAAAQWTGPLRRRGIPFGVQQAENLQRALPRIAGELERLTVGRASFVACRSPAARARVHTIRTGTPAPVVAHTFRGWPDVSPPRASLDGGLKIGYAGRLVREKGLLDLVAALELMTSPATLSLYGDGPQRDELERRSTLAHPISVHSGTKHEDMGAAYAAMDVLVLPSRSTPTWTEQFGRVLIEAMSCGRPAIASESGEIPWVMRQTGGGVTYPEGDVTTLARQLDRMAVDHDWRIALGATGRSGVEQHFSVTAVTGQLDRALRACIPSADGLR
jgi:glycosyltransferase involved in cell wall biosynthesis